MFFGWWSLRADVNCTFCGKSVSRKKAEKQDPIACRGCRQGTGRIKPQGRRAKNKRRRG